jgi:hypothetical protein
MIDPLNDELSSPPLQAPTSNAFFCVDVAGSRDRCHQIDVMDDVIDAIGNGDSHLSLGLRREGAAPTTAAEADADIPVLALSCSAAYLLDQGGRVSTVTASYVSLEPATQEEEESVCRERRHLVLHETTAWFEGIKASRPTGSASQTNTCCRNAAGGRTTMLRSLRHGLIRPAEVVSSSRTGFMSRSTRSGGTSSHNHEVDAVPSGPVPTRNHCGNVHRGLRRI